MLCFAIAGLLYLIAVFRALVEPDKTDRIITLVGACVLLGIAIVGLFRQNGY